MEQHGTLKNLKDLNSPVKQKIGHHGTLIRDILNAFNVLELDRLPKSTPKQLGTLLVFLGCEKRLASAGLM